MSDDSLEPLSDLGFKVGDRVAYKKDQDGIQRRGLVSGSWIYTYAIVVAVDRFTLISEKGDMLWSATVRPEEFEKVGEATREELIRAIERLGRR